jgi:hypothetical protein
MELIFEDTANRYQCSCEYLVNDMRMPCTFSTSRIVKIPKGLSYLNGKLEVNQDVLGSTLSICKNHEGRLKIAYDELFKKA